ncbi:MAG: energy transducer TonB [Synergistetes bacterium]|nr:energy transducer TonB [Synergistota bacterium]MCX8128112.1 energy transducer TonB [Synergistota bacterium]MDW8192488.1 energy transducer TonB [Synergistota bacterium]
MNQKARFSIFFLSSLIFHLLILQCLTFPRIPLEKKVLQVTLVENTTKHLIKGEEFLKGGTTKHWKTDKSFNILSDVKLSIRNISTNKAFLNLKVTVKSQNAKYQKPFKKEANKIASQEETKENVKQSLERREIATTQERELKSEKESEEMLFIPPKPINSRKPAYPLLARKMKYEGIVVLDIEVLPDGSVGEVKIVESSGYELLDKAASEEVKNWQFIPAYRNGKPVKSIVRQKVIFKLK